MARKNTIKKNALPVPQTKAGAEQLIAEIGQMQRQLSRLEVDMNSELEAIRNRFDAQAKPLNHEIDSAFTAVHAWAEANRSTLLVKGLKSIKLATGVIAWRITPPAAAVRGKDAVIKALKAFWPEAVRLKEEINKDVILGDPEKARSIAGISITQKEEFKVIPNESEIERTVMQAIKEAA